MFFFIPTYQVHKRISNLCFVDLKVELEASTDLMATAGQVGGVTKRANRQLAAAVEWSSVRKSELSVVSEHESVASSAATGLLASNSQASRASAVGDGGTELHAGVDLVMEDSTEIVVEAALDGGVDVALGEVVSELFALERAVKSEASLHTNIATWAGCDDCVKVERVLGIGVQVDISLVVAPGQLNLVQLWDRASGEWPFSNGGDLGHLSVLKLHISSGLAWVERFLDLHTTARAGVLDLKAGSNSLALQSTLGGELEAVSLAGELHLVVSMLEALVEEVIGLLGEITVLDWHFGSEEKRLD